MIAKPGNHEGVSYYLLRCTANRKKLYDPKESDGMLFPIGKLYICMYPHTYMNKYLSNFKILCHVPYFCTYDLIIKKK